MPAQKPHRLLLIDDHHLFNDGLKSLLNGQIDIEICGQVFAAQDVLPVIQQLMPDVILLDINLQGANGIDLGRKLVADYPKLRIILLTMYREPKLIEEAQRSGVHGYLLKEATTDTLLHCIRTVMAGGTYFDIDKKVPADNSFGDDFAKRLNLTFREVEIIRLIRDGLSSEQIADQLYLSVETIKKHRSNIYFKLGITKVAELIQFAFRNGL